MVEKPTYLPVWVTQQQATPIPRHIAVPQSDDANTVHTRLAELSQKAHELAAAGDEAGLEAVEVVVDQPAAELWGIAEKELKEMRRSLEELSQVRAGLTTARGVLSGRMPTGPQGERGTTLGKLGAS